MVRLVVMLLGGQLHLTYDAAETACNSLDRGDSKDLEGREIQR